MLVKRIGKGRPKRQKLRGEGGSERDEGLGKKKGEEKGQA